MTVDFKTLTMANLSIQILLFIVASGAVYFAKKRELGRHCTLMRVIVPIHVITIAVVMLPSMVVYLKNGEPGKLFNIEMLVHHTLGLATVVLCIYIILAFGKSWMLRNFRAIMRSAFIVWIISLLFGLHMYFRIWT